MAYYFGLLGVVLAFAVRHLFRPSGAADPVLTQEFVDRFGISNREREIVSMIMQGYPNRTVGERLYISDRTVKNHISSIYRKTGAVNKVQLLNMVRNHPGDDRPRQSLSGISDNRDFRPIAGSLVRDYDLFHGSRQREGIKSQYCKRLRKSAMRPSGVPSCWRNRDGLVDLVPISLSTRD